MKNPPKGGPRFGDIFRFTDKSGYEAMFISGLADGDWYGIGLTDSAWFEVGEVNVFDDLDSPAWSYVGRIEEAGPEHEPWKRALIERELRTRLKKMSSTELSATLAKALER